MDAFVAVFRPKDNAIVVMKTSGMAPIEAGDPGRFSNHSVGSTSAQPDAI